MALRMLASSVARVVEHRCGRRSAAEGPIVAHIDPCPAGMGLALGQNRHRRVIAVQALGRQHIGFEAIMERTKGAAAGAHLIGKRREAQRHAFTLIALGLAVQRLLLAGFPGAWPKDRGGEASRRHMEGRGRLADLLAIAAGELLAHMLDHLPLPRDHLVSVSVMSSPSFASRVPPQQAQEVGPGTITRSRGRCSGSGLREGTLAAEGSNVGRLAAAFSAAKPSSLAELSSSSSCNSS